MVFSSNIFLFGFLPWFLLIYYVIHPRHRNLFLFISSIGFYFWGAGSVAGIMVAMLCLNYQLGRFVVGRGWLLALGALANLSYLFYFKYYHFFRSEIDRAGTQFGWHLGAGEKILLPIGISFSVFQGISYLADCYLKKHKPAPSFLVFGTYLTAFPHVIAGPIVRYDHIREQLFRRPLDLDKLFLGIWRFALGLGKKVLLANTLGAVADQIMGQTPLSELRSGVAWLGALCYTFQIYYDFSGYSDMAIGLGYMLGFTFPENFNQPYRSASVTEFWRRWHMTLSSWFRDYVYIPLGGNRTGPVRTYFNLACVFALTGLWHGAAWTFVFWGCYHGVLLICERVLRNRFNFQATGPIGVAATFILVMFGWVFFRLDSIGQAFEYCGVMFGLGRATAFQVFPLSYYLQASTITALLLGFFFALFPIERFSSLVAGRSWGVVLQGMASMALLLLTAVSLSVSSFNPFIYFRF